MPHTENKDRIEGSPSWFWPNIGSSSCQAHTEPDSFESRAVTNLVREVTQNSIDAAEGVCEMSFEIKKNVANLEKYFEGINKFRDDCGKGKFKLKEIDLLIIKDFSGGIQGETSGSREQSDIWRFLLDWGKKGKDGSMLGSKSRGRISFPFSSKMGCVMFSTKRKKDSVIGGFGILEGKEFDDGDGYSYMLDSQCVFAKNSRGSIYELHDEVDDFNKDFGIDFGSKFGTAIIIPFPRDEITLDFKDRVLATIIENFAPKIIRDELKVSVENDQLNIKNLEGVMQRLCSSELNDLFENSTQKNFQKNGLSYIRFLTTSITTLFDRPAFEIDLDDSVEIQVETFSQEQSEKFNTMLQANEIITMKFNFQIQLQGNKKVGSFIEIAFQKPNTGEGIETYHRSGMVMQQQRPQLGRSYHAALLCRDEELSRILNIVEGTGHNKWVLKKGEGKKKFENELSKEGINYDTSEIEKVVRLCQFALRDIKKSIVNHDTVVAAAHLAKFFPTIDNDDTVTRTPGETGGGKTTPTPTPPIPESEGKFIFTQTNKGISIKHDTDQTELPEKIRVSLFAQSDATLGGKNNDDAMDEFGNVRIQSSNCEVEKNKNIIDIQNIKSGWEINIDRFKPFFMGGCTINELKEET